MVVKGRTKSFTKEKGETVLLYDQIVFYIYITLGWAKSG